MTVRVLLIVCGVLVLSFLAAASEVRDEASFAILLSGKQMHETIAREAVESLRDDETERPEAREMWGKVVKQGNFLRDLFTWYTEWDRLASGLCWNDMPDDAVIHGNADEWRVDNMYRLIKGLFATPDTGKMLDEDLAKRSHYLDLQYFHSMKPCIERDYYLALRDSEKEIQTEKLKELEENMRARIEEEREHAEAILRDEDEDEDEDEDGGEHANENENEDNAEDEDGGAVEDESDLATLMGPQPQPPSDQPHDSVVAQKGTQQQEPMQEELSKQEQDLDEVFTKFLETETRYQTTYDCADVTNQEVKDMILRQAMVWWMKACTDSWVPKQAIWKNKKERQLRNTLMTLGMNGLYLKLLTERKFVLFQGAFMNGIKNTVFRAPLFFLGNLIHMIQDSYSCAHARRRYTTVHDREEPLADNWVVYFQGYDAQNSDLHEKADVAGPGGLKEGWHKRAGAWDAYRASRFILHTFGAHKMYEGEEEKGGDWWMEQGEKQCIAGAVEVLDFLKDQVYVLVRPDLLAGGSDPAYHTKGEGCEGETIKVPGKGPDGGDLEVKRCLAVKHVSFGDPVKGRDGKCFEKGEGDCKRASLLSTCGGDDSKCQSDEADPCKGVCICAPGVFDVCTCVKADVDGAPEELHPGVC